MKRWLYRGFLGGLFLEIIARHFTRETVCCIMSRLERSLVTRSFSLSEQEVKL